jgi:hypothetical protein
VVSAALAFSFAQDTWAWGSGGSISGGFKSVFNGNSLFCDLDDPGSTVAIFADVTTGTFRFGAEPDGDPLTSTTPKVPAEAAVICWEYTAGGDPVTSRQTDKGNFWLIQVRSENGLAVTSEVLDLDNDGNADDTRYTYSFTVQNGQRNENLLWRLVPVDANTQAIFCIGENNAPIPAKDCGANFGLDEGNKATFSGLIYDGGGDGEIANHYPARDVDDIPGDDLVAGEVFRFITEQLDEGPEQPKSLLWGPFHNGVFDLRVPVSRQFGQGGTAKQLIAKGKVDAIVSVDIDIDPSSTENLLNRSSDGVLLVEVFGSADLSVADIDPATVTLEGAAMTFVSASSESALFEVNIAALVTSSTALPAASPGDTVTLTLRAETLRGSLVEGTDAVTIMQPVVVDHKPGNCSNPLAGTGVEPVAILGGFTGTFDDNAFDVTTIAVSTVTLSSADVPAEQANYSDVSTSDGRPQSETCSLGGDGVPDLLLKFDSASLAGALEVQAAAKGDPVTLELKGELTNGAKITGTTTVIKNY